MTQSQTYGQEVEDATALPVAVVEVVDENTAKVLRRFRTVKEAEEYVGTLPGVETGRYGIDAPEGMSR